LVTRVTDVCCADTVCRRGAASVSDVHYHWN